MIDYADKADKNWFKIPPDMPQDGWPFHYHKWRGWWQQIAWEIVWEAEYHNGAHPTGSWFYYVSLLEPQLPPPHWQELWQKPSRVDEKGRVFYNGHNTLFADLHWHGGMDTYGQYSSVVEGALRHIRAGCDYQHLFDTDQCYTLGVVWDDVRYTIMSLRAALPDLRYRDYYDGTYHDAEHIYETRDGGQYVSIAGARKEMARALTEVQDE